MLKASLPNDWSYEFAEEVVRDYVQRNFVDKGMCADWAIHDSENDKGQHNLHIHVLFTMRLITENGERVPLIDKKTGQQKVDKRNRKQWKADMQSLQAEYNSIGKEQTKTATELAYAEIISYSKKTLKGNFRTRADSTTDNRAERNRGRKKFNGNLIET